MYTMRTDIYTRVTDRIVADLEKGVRPWLKPWSGGPSATRITIPLRSNGEAYRGINILLLWSEAIDKGYQSPHWMTYRQALELGGYVRKGESGSPVVYANHLSRKEMNEEGLTEERSVYLLRGYTVFNTDQIDGLPARFRSESVPPLDKIAVIETAERFFDATGATFRHGGDQAYYTEGADAIQLPPPAAFKDAESYAATKAHELTHWTKHAKRLNRDFGRERFGDEGYAHEELVAELGAAFLCAELGVTPEIRRDHAEYIDHWLKVLKGDKRAIFVAAAHAQRAVDFLKGLQPAVSVDTQQETIA